MTVLSKVVLLVLLSSLAAPLLAQDNNGNEVVGDVNFSIFENLELPVQPAKLLPESKRIQFRANASKLVKANAAPYYYRAVAIWNARPSELRNLIWEKRANWIECSLDEMPVDEVQSFLDMFESVFAELETATGRAECDWELGLDQLRFAEFIQLPLYEVDAMRSLGRLNRLQTRIQLSKRDFPAAIESIQRGFRMASDTARLRLTVAGLVGESIANTTLESVAELSQVSGSPNLAYGLASIPTPIVDFFPHVQSEQQLIERSFPLLDSPETSKRNVASWRQEFLDTMEQLDSLHTAFGTDGDAAKSREARTALMLARLYPIAKRELVGAGWDAGEVEAMPVGQVVAIQTSIVWKGIIEPISRLRYMSGQAAIDEAKRQRQEFRDEGYNTPSSRGDFPFGEVGPPVFDVRVVPSIRRSINRKLAMLKTTELLRDYAARNNSFPESLNDLGSPHQILDPTNGKPFEYQRTSDTRARLQSETIAPDRYPDQRIIEMRFELELVRER